MISAFLFTTSRCGYCPAAKQALIELEDEFDEDELEVTIIVADKDQKSMALTEEWGVSSVPTLILSQDAWEVERLAGNITKERVREYLERYLQRDVLSESSGGSDEGSGSVLRSSGESQNSGT